MAIELHTLSPLYYIHILSIKLSYNSHCGWPKLQALIKKSSNNIINIEYATQKNI